MSEAEVCDNTAEQRYELAVDGELAVAAYRLEGDRVVFTHTVVPAAIEGRGFGSRLVGAVLADVRRRGLSVVPECPFVRAYIERHPEERDLLA